MSTTPPGPLVIRAGGGSPRDTLSVLDQLLAGADGNRVTYQRALGWRGATDVAVIDAAVDALAAGDAAAMFGAVESVIGTPRTTPDDSPPTYWKDSAICLCCKQFPTPLPAAWWMLLKTCWTGCANRRLGSVRRRSPATPKSSTLV